MESCHCLNWPAGTTQWLAGQKIEDRLYVMSRRSLTEDYEGIDDNFISPSDLHMIIVARDPARPASLALAQQLIPSVGILSSVKNKMNTMQTSPQAREPSPMISSFLAKP
jgi:hypothetical protein